VFEEFQKIINESMRIVLGKGREARLDKSAKIVSMQLELGWLTFDESVFVYYDCTLNKIERGLYPSYLRNIMQPPEVKAHSTTNLKELWRVTQVGTARTIFHNGVAQYNKLLREVKSQFDSEEN